MKDSYNEVFKDVKKVMAVFAHPDDAEVISGGLISRLAADGKDVYLVVTTNGGKGMQDRLDTTEESFAKERLEEQKKAGHILGIKKENNINLNIPDGEFEETFENIGKIVKQIRTWKPDLVITHNPHEHVIEFGESSTWVNHRDHRNTGSVVFDAVYPYSRDRGFFIEHFREGLEPYIVNKLLVADSYNHPKVKYFNISKHITQKLTALQNHPSAINPEHAADYLEENLYEGSYFEPLRYIEVY